MTEDGERGARSALRRVAPSEAKSLLDLGYVYVDVRNIEEFHAEHPAQALNVPLSTPAGSNVPVAGNARASDSDRHPGAGFLEAMSRLFAREAKIVVGCATGVRSLRAAEWLVAAGFTDVVEQRAGMDGARGPFGNLVEPGWAEAGLPVSTGPDEGSYAALQGKADARARS